MKHHTYAINVQWTGNTGEGTSNYRSYRRNHVITANGKPEIQGSSDPAFRGDAGRYNPEELLVASLSACHMLEYLHMCADHHITVVEYSDSAAGAMEERADGSGAFAKVTLRPSVRISQGYPAAAAELHHEAHRLCFIANSVNFPVEVAPAVTELLTHSARSSS